MWHAKGRPVESSPGGRVWMRHVGENPKPSRQTTHICPPIRDFRFGLPALDSIQQSPRVRPILHSASPETLPAPIQSGRYPFQIGADQKDRPNSPNQFTASFRQPTGIGSFVAGRYHENAAIPRCFWRDVEAADL